jgi:ABC-type cobalamin/Fe3+-siderophores transport system ATPase subunit
VAREGAAHVSEAIFSTERLTKRYGGLVACNSVCLRLELIACGSPEDVVTSANLQRLYDVAVDIVNLPDQERRLCVPQLR